MAYDLLRGTQNDRDWGIGSIVLSAKDQDKILAQISLTRETVAKEVASTRKLFGGALFAIAGGITLLAASKFYTGKA
jgi:hypothetical protein